MTTGEADIHHHACGHQTGPVEQRLDAVRNYPAGVPANSGTACGGFVANTTYSNKIFKGIIRSFKLKELDLFYYLLDAEEFSYANDML